MQYAELDKRIIKAISDRQSPLYDKTVNEEAIRLAVATGRDDFDDNGDLLPAVATQ